MLNNVPSDKKSGDSDEIKRLLEENLAVSKEIREISFYIKKFIFWQKIFGILKLLIILIPLVIGFIYLPPLLSQMIEQYNSILDLSAGINNTPTGQILDLLK